MSRRASKRLANIHARQGTSRKVVKPEDGMLYGKSDEVVADFMADADPETAKRLERLSAKDDENKQKWLRKTTTRADVFNCMSIWQTKFLMPMAQRLDHVEAYLEYLEKPFWERWWLRYGPWILARLPFTVRRIDESGVDGDVRGEGEDSPSPVA